MTNLGALLDTHGDALLGRWRESLRHEGAATNPAELHAHVPGLLKELRAALHEGRAPLTSPSAIDHGERGQARGFDVEAVVREYRLLMNAILDGAEAEGLTLTMTEVRIVTEFVSRAVAHGVAAHRRYEQRSTQVVRSRLEGLFQNAPAFMAALHGPSHVFTLANEPYQRLVGPGRPLLGLSVAAAVPEVVAQGFITLLDEVYRSGVAHVGKETRIDFDRGSGLEDAYLSFVYQPTRDASGAVDGIDVFGFDVTEQARARQRVEALVREVRAREEELRLVVDAVPLLVSFVAADQRYGLANHAYEDWFGLPRDGIRGRTVVEVVGEKAYAQLGPFVKRALAGEHIAVEQYDVPYARGGVRDVSITFVPRHDPGGAVAGYVVIIDDITARRRLAAERERLLEAERAARRDGDALRQLMEVERDLATAVAAMEADSRHASEEARARTEFLLTVAAAINETLELDVMLQRLVEIIAPAHALVASVWSALDGQPLRRVVHAPFREALVDVDPSVTLGSETAAADSVRRALDTAETLHIADYGAAKTEEGAPEVGRSIVELGVGPVLLVPIRRGRTAVAVLGVARAHDATFSEDDIVVFESVARLAALAFENARLFGEMARLRSAAEEATLAKDRFLAHVSHDLRNPLNSILGWSTLLRGMKNDPVQLMRGLDVIDRNAKSQVQLIEDLLDISRITSGKLALELAVSDVRAVFDTGLDAARLAASSKNVQLVVTVDDNIGAITVDPDRFRQILWNLVSNAVKFTPSGGTVCVNAQRRASTFQLVVADTGRGISPAFLPRVFASFEQAEAGARRTGGLGLGLAIVRHLVELHGGTIRAESEGEGRGASFTVELPIRAAVRSPDASPPPETPRALAGIRILVVDDEEDAREVVKLILENAGAEVTLASSADEALAALARELPRVIVSDIGMPGTDGKAFLRAVRALPEARGGRIPAIALTALVRGKDRVEILSAGFNAHVAKPVEPEELVLVVAGVFG